MWLVFTRVWISVLFWIKKANDVKYDDVLLLFEVFVWGCVQILKWRVFVLDKSSICRCVFFSSRQWRHVRQALHPDRQPREHRVSVAPERVNVPWVCTQGLCSLSSVERALLLWQREHELVSLFTSPESPERLSHVWHRKIKLVCAAPC